MTQVQLAIILTSIINTVLNEYDEDESSNAIRELKFICSRFMTSQSGTVVIPFKGTLVKDKQKFKTFMNTVSIGDRIWQKALDRYAKQSLFIEATSIIRAVYDFAPDILGKHAHISAKKINAVCAGSVDGDEKAKRDGTIVGGYLVELLAEEMGLKINGRLRALRMKVQREVAA